MVPMLATFAEAGWRGASYFDLCGVAMTPIGLSCKVFASMVKDTEKVNDSPYVQVPSRKDLRMSRSSLILRVLCLMMLVTSGRAAGDDFPQPDPARMVCSV